MILSVSHTFLHIRRFLSALFPWKNCNKIIAEKNHNRDLSLKTKIKKKKKKKGKKK